MKRAMVGSSSLLAFLLVVSQVVPSSGQANASSASSSVNSPLIANVTGRTAISLDGTWNTIVDPYETGVGSRFYENAKPKTKSDLVEYDFDRSAKLRVPGDWNTQRESLLFYEGVIWYQRYFSYPKRAHTRTFLYFGAANYQARVWLNGAELGEHQGSYLVLTLGITRIIEQQSLDIAIWGSQDNAEWGAKPMLSFPQKFYCGTYQLLLDLNQHPGVKYLRAKWQVSRWGRGDPKPLFGIYLFVQDAGKQGAIAKSA